MIFFLILPKKFMAWLSKVWSGGILWFAKVFLGITMKVTDFHYLPKGPFILACKHQSAWETLALNLVVHHPAFFLKKTLMYIPVFGWAFGKLGMIPVKRGKGNHDFLGKARYFALKEGRPLIIFPEGTRVAPGQKGVYKKGVYFTACALDIPVVPVALNSGFFWPRRGFFKKPGVIELVFLKPLEAKGLTVQIFMQQLQEVIEKRCEVLGPH